MAITSTGARFGTGRTGAGSPLSTQDRPSCEHTKAETAVGTELDRPSRAGTRALRDRLVPVGLGRIGNLVINNRSSHIVEALALSDQTRPWTDADGVRGVGPLALTHLLNDLSDVATAMMSAEPTSPAWRPR